MIFCVLQKADNEKAGLQKRNGKSYERAQWKKI